MSEYSAAKIWGNFFLHEKLDPSKVNNDDVLLISELIHELSARYPEPKPYRQYKNRLLHRRYICETAIDLGIDIVKIKHTFTRKVIAGRGLLDIWAVVYKERFGDNIGTNVWFETKRRDIKMKMGKRNPEEK